MVPHSQGPFLAGYTPVTDAAPHCYGLRRLDHAVGNVPDMAATLAYVKRMTGFHEFAEFTAEVGRLACRFSSLRMPVQTQSGARRLGGALYQSSCWSL